MAYLKKFKNSPYWYIIDGCRSLSTRKKDKRAAAEILREYNGEQVRGKLNLGGRQSSMTMSQLLEKQLKDYSAIDFKERTVGLYKDSFRDWIVTMGDVRITNVDVTMVQDYMRIRKKDLKPTSINMRFRTLRAVFNRAVGWQDIRHNPFNDVEPLSEGNERPRRAVLPDEWPKFMAAIKDERFRLFYRFAVLCGGRLSEIMALRDTDFDVKLNGMFKHDTKHDKTRPIPVNKIARTLLQEYLMKYPPQPGGRIFPWHPLWPSRKFCKIRREAGIPDGVTFHSLRHTFAMTLLSQGTDIYTVKELLGHSSIKVTEKYLHSIPGVMNNAVEKLNF